MAAIKRGPFLGLNSADLLSSQGKNRYQAVLAAAKIARRLNDVKVADYEAAPEAERVIEAHKVTSMALEMLLRGEIQFHAIDEGGKIVNEGPART
jgi:DNA-directed RNA polymerase subunit K/omega